MRIVFYMFLFSLCLGCGLQKGSYIDYASPKSPTNDCAAGGKAFESKLSPAVDETCATSGCHGSTPIQGGVLIAGDSSNNRLILLGFAKDDGSNLFNKIGQREGSTHGGLDQSEILSLETIQSWMTAEASCE